ncbi:MAG: hypothetical protein JXQ75_23685 [Phycisphaerae bacterium]|nr:hypothetical protein [Phycisphaerae bacterium]
MTQEQPDRSEEERRLDHLLIEATGDYSLVPDRPKEAYDPAESDRVARRKYVRKLVTIIVVSVLAGGAMISYLIYNYMEHVSARKLKAERLAEESARIAAITKDATADVKSHVSMNRFVDALNALELAKQNGLPVDVWGELDAEIRKAVTDHTTAEVRRLLPVHEFDEASRKVEAASFEGLPHEARNDLDVEIKKAALARRTELLDKVEEEIKKRSLETARPLLDQVKALDKYGADGQRLSTVLESIRRLEREKELEPGKRSLAQSREAAEKKDWDTAIALLERARQEPHEGPELERWAEELSKTVLGRLRIVGKPDGATVHVPGLEAARIGDVIWGLSPGLVDVLADAEGYVPERISADVPGYPNVNELTVNLTPEAPGPVWAICALSGHCAQGIAAEYYRRNYKGADWIDSLSGFLKPCKPKSPGRKSKPSKRELPAMIRAAEEAFLADSKEPVGALDSLGEFTTNYPKSLRTILKECDKKIGEVLGIVEQGCAHCAGQGHVPCPECGGLGERVEKRACPTCQGTGRVPHEACGGTGIVKCKRCGGTGQVLEATRVQRGDKWVTESKSVPCPKCDGKGTVRCRCGDGFVACPDCNRSGKRELLGPCSACGGHGHLPCEVCGATGRRDKMDLQKRREAEQAIAHPDATEP